MCQLSYKLQSIPAISKAKGVKSSIQFRPKLRVDALKSESRVQSRDRLRVDKRLDSNLRGQLPNPILGITNGMSAYTCATCYARWRYVSISELKPLIPVISDILLDTRVVRALGT